MSKQQGGFELNHLKAIVGGYCEQPLLVKNKQDEKFITQQNTSFLSKGSFVVLADNWNAKSGYGFSNVSYDQDKKKFTGRYVSGKSIEQKIIIGKLSKKIFLKKEGKGSNRKYNALDSDPAKIATTVKENLTGLFKSAMVGNLNDDQNNPILPGLFIQPIFLPPELKQENNVDEHGNFTNPGHIVTVEIMYVAGVPHIHLYDPAGKDNKDDNKTILKEFLQNNIKGKNGENAVFTENTVNYQGKQESAQAGEVCGNLNCEFISKTCDKFIYEGKDAIAGKFKDDLPKQLGMMAPTDKEYPKYLTALKEKQKRFYSVDPEEDGLNTNITKELNSSKNSYINTSKGKAFKPVTGQNKGFFNPTANYLRAGNALKSIGKSYTDLGEKAINRNVVSRNLFKLLDIILTPFKLAYKLVNPFPTVEDYHKAQMLKDGELFTFDSRGIVNPDSISAVPEVRLSTNVQAAASYNKSFIISCILGVGATIALFLLAPHIGLALALVPSLIVGGSIFGISDIASRIYHNVKYADKMGYKPGFGNTPNQSTFSYIKSFFGNDFKYIRQVDTFISPNPGDTKIINPQNLDADQKKQYDNAVKMHVDPTKIIDNSKDLNTPQAKQEAFKKLFDEQMEFGPRAAKQYLAKYKKDEPPHI